MDQFFSFVLKYIYFFPTIIITNKHYEMYLGFFVSPYVQNSKKYHHVMQFFFYEHVQLQMKPYTQYIHTYTIHHHIIVNKYTNRHTEIHHLPLCYFYLTFYYHRSDRTINQSIHQIKPMPMPILPHHTPIASIHHVFIVTKWLQSTPSSLPNFHN